MAHGGIGHDRADHLEARADAVDTLLVDEPRERRDGLEPHFLRLVLEVLQDVRDLRGISDLAYGPPDRWQ